MKTFKLTAGKVSEDQFGEEIDLAEMKQQQAKFEKTLTKGLNKIISSTIDGNLTLTIVYEPAI